jgi:TPR repeat protein
MRYCVFALTLVICFMTGFFISDVFVNVWPVTTPRYQVAVVQITRPPTPPPEITKPPTPDPSINSKKPVPPASVPESAASSLSALQNAADGGDLIAQWKLGRMYADGDGVAQDDLRAFEYFRRIADTHAEDSPSAPQAAIVANAFVALGRYYLSGIPNSSIKADPERAREMFSYAASHLGNNAMTILALIIQLYGGTWELPMPSMKACRTFVAKMEQTVPRPPFIYCINVGPGWPRSDPGLEFTQEPAPDGTAREWK